MISQKPHSANGHGIDASNGDNPGHRKEYEPTRASNDSDCVEGWAIGKDML